MYFILAIVIILSPILIIAAIVSSSISSSHQEKKKQFFEKSYHLSMKGAYTTSIKTAKACLSEMEAGYAEIKDFSSKNSRKCYEEDIEDVRENLNTLQIEQWEQRADKILDHFSELYTMIAEVEFEDVEKAYKSKKQCISYWDRYWESIHDCEAIVYPKEYLRNYFSSDFDPCMESKAALSAKLDACILAMQPEYKRKMRIYDDIIEYVDLHKSVKRSVLLQVQFPESTSEEVASCYKALKAAHRLIEMKVGKYYFVTLTDNEKEKRKHIAKAKKDDSQASKIVTTMEDKNNDPPDKFETTVEKPAPLISPSVNTKVMGQSSGNEVKHYTFSEFIEFLTTNGIVFVNKTSTGGCLWVEYNEKTNPLVENARINNQRLVIAKHTKNFKGNPGWYIPR